MRTLLDWIVLADSRREWYERKATLLLWHPANHTNEIITLINLDGAPALSTCQVLRGSRFKLWLPHVRSQNVQDA